MQGVLLLFVAAGIGFWIWGKITIDPVAAEFDAPIVPGAATEEPPTGPVVRVTYFTDDIKCESCLLIERLTRQALQQNYQEELRSGRVFYEKRNMNHPENQPFVEGYGLSFKTVVIADVRDGEVTDWRRMDDVWSLLHREQDFLEYLSGGITQALQNQGADPGRTSRAAAAGQPAPASSTGS
jgi:hypothetical protein